MACGIPVVSTDVGIGLEVFGEQQRRFIIGRPDTGSFADAVADSNGVSAEAFLWYLPFRTVDDEGVAKARLRGLVVSSDVFREIVDLFNGDANLSKSEKRTLFHPVGGLDLRETARIDDVSFETMRAHTKAASDKLCCPGQKDLVRYAMGELVHLMSVSESELKLRSLWSRSPRFCCRTMCSLS